MNATGCGENYRNGNGNGSGFSCRFPRAGSDFSTVNTETWGPRFAYSPLD